MQWAKKEFLFDFSSFPHSLSFRWFLLTLAMLHTQQSTEQTFIIFGYCAAMDEFSNIFSIHTLFPPFVHIRFFSVSFSIVAAAALVFYRDMLTNTICDLMPNCVVSVNVSLMIHCMRTLWICVCAYCFVTPYPYVLHFVAVNTQVSKTNFAYTRTRVVHLYLEWKGLDF